jgi:hypothetical protein
VEGHQAIGIENDLEDTALSSSGKLILQISVNHQITSHNSSNIGMIVNTCGEFHSHYFGGN